MTGIPTQYQGIWFRSRVEARWAAMFDVLGWPWEYEPLDLNGYIPDFVVSFYRPLLVEVKYSLELPELYEHTGKIDRSGWKHEAVIVGATPVFASVDSHQPDLVWPLGGLIREHSDPDLPTTNPDAWWWEGLRWHRCLHCNELSIHHSSASYRCRVNGCYDGNTYLGPVGPDELRRGWATAHNQTAWQAA